MAKFLLKHKVFVIALFAVLLVGSAVLMRLVNINYELGDYLPDNMNTKQALAIMQREFGIPSSVRVMVEDVEIYEALEIKAQMAAVDNVNRVLWLDDVTDVYVPLEYIKRAYRDKYYRDGTALFFVEIGTSDYAVETGDTLERIAAICGDKTTIYGGAVSGAEVRTASTGQIRNLIFILVPVILVILLFATNAWIEPFIFLAVLGVAICINEGTNAFLGNVSFITRSMSTALQLAISMDYSIFLLHRFSEERARGLSVEHAMQTALHKSAAAIVSSSITTVAGFLALLLMQFRLGADMGIVFAKGILLSLLCVMTLLPVIAVYASKLIERTHHRNFMPPFARFGQIVYKLRYVVVFLAIILIVPSYLGQRANDFVYGGSTISASEESPSFQAKQAIDAKFGPYNPVILLLPKGDDVKETALIGELQQCEFINEIQGVYAVFDKNIPNDLQPARLTRQFEGDAYTRIIISTALPEESPETFAAVERIERIASMYYDEWYLAGVSASTLDIKYVADTDYLLVNTLAVAAVALILLLTFRSISLPIILIVVIETAIFINMSIPYFTGYRLSFVGYLVVSALQLGATIDYAILFTSRYIERRGTINPQIAVVGAISDSAGSILTSGGILALSGIIISMVSTVETVRELGMLIGRGALLSVCMVFLLLPALLVLCDGIVQRTTLYTHRRKPAIADAEPEPEPES